MNWDLLDFLVFGGMISALLLIILVARRRSANPSYRFAMAIAGLGAFLVAWINGAVGIIGNEDNDANLLFFGVLGVAAVGALLARFKAGGMAKTMYFVAGLQVFVAAFAVAADLGAGGPAWPRGLLSITAVITLVWLSSAWLFGKAAKRERRFFVD